MYKPAGLLRFKEGSVQSKTKVPKPLIGLFLTLNAIFGYNFGFTKNFNKYIQILFKFLSIVAFLVWIYCLSYPLLKKNDANLPKISIVVELSEYVTFFFILNLSKQNFPDFIKSINQNLEVIPELNLGCFTLEILKSLGITASVYVVAVVFIRLLGIGISCILYQPFLCNMNVVDYLLAICGLSLEGVSLLLTLITHYIYCYAKKFNQLARSQTDMNTNSLFKYYFNLADCYDYIMQLYDRLIAALLLVDVPKLLFVLYGVLVMIKGSPWFYYIGHALFAVQVMTRLIVPCIITEMIKTQIESARLALHHRMLNETGTKKKEIQELLQYMCVRHLHHKAWRVIPLDVNLPLAVVSTCVTYVIVIAQFSHLY